MQANVKQGLEGVPDSGLFADLRHALFKRPVSEAEVGLDKYVNTAGHPIEALLKERFSDFCVNEISPSGHVVHLTQITSPGPEKSASTIDDALPEPPKSHEEIVHLFEPILGPSKAGELASFCMSDEELPHKSHPEQSPAYFLTDAMPDKMARTSFHQQLRVSFQGTLVSEAATKENGDPCIRVARKSSSEGKKFRKFRKNPVPDAGRYIHGTLQKTNRETHETVSALAKTLLLKDKDIGVAGTKDKRGITVQRISIRRGNKTLDYIYRTGFRHKGYFEAGVTLGNLEYADAPINLGMAQGNRFRLILRNVSCAEGDVADAIETAVRSLANHGFLNYFGMQRFGAISMPTHVVGAALIKGDWHLAVHLLLSERADESPRVLEARSHYTRDHDANEAFHKMPRQYVAERAILGYISKNGTSDALGALNAIPANLKRMYGHAYQSYIFNKALSKRVELYGATRAVPGDLVVTSGSLADDNDSSSVAVRPIEAHEVDNFSVFDIVLPQPGYASVLPTNAVGEYITGLLARDGINSLDAFQRPQRDFSLPGAYRPLVLKAADVTHRILVASSTPEDLQSSDLDVLNGTQVNPVEYKGQALEHGQSLALQIAFSLGSSTYATMALRELLKADTSSATQKAKSLDSKDEQRNE